MAYVEYMSKIINYGVIIDFEGIEEPIDFTIMFIFVSLEMKFWLQGVE